MVTVADDFWRNALLFFLAQSFMQFGGPPSTN
jgi:hypothetical protein